MAGALVFVDAREVNKDELMLFYRHIAGNDVEFLYFPLTDDIDFTQLCHNYNYKKNAQTGNPLYPKDNYFIIKVIGSIFDISIQYFSTNNYDDDEYIPLFNNKEFIKEHASEIVVSAKLALDRFISDYKISLATQACRRSIIHLGKRG